MSYKILSDDIKAGSSKNWNNNKKRKGKGKFKINPMHIHVVIIVIIVLLLLYYVFTNFDFKFKHGTDDKEMVILVGTLNTFDESYNKSLNLYASEFTLKTRTGKFDGYSKDIEIKNFNGHILYQNNSMVFIGTAKVIEFGNNELNLNGDTFILNSTKKTTLDLSSNTLQLNFKSGRIKLNSDLNYEFTNSTIILNNYNFSLTYDGTFSFMGTTDSFLLMAKNPNLQISYTNE